MFKSRVALAATLSAQLRHLQRLRAARARAAPGQARNISIPRSTRSRPGTGTSPATSRTTSRGSTAIRRDNPALQQTSNLRFLQVDDGKVIGFAKESVDRRQRRRGRDRADRADRASSGSTSATSRSGRPATRRRVARDREPDHRRASRDRMGRRAAAHRSGAAIPPCCFAAWREGPRHERRCRTIDAGKPTARAGDELWYKDAIIYQLHVKAFADSNDDGIGDFAGLTEKLDYLQDLGVTALWLLPFYPSPRPRRRLRHRRLPAHQSRLRHAAGFPALHARGATGAACASSPSWSSTTPPTSTPGSSARAAAQPGLARAQLLRLERHRPEVPRTRASSSPTPRSRTGPGIRKPAAYYWHRFFSHQPDLNFDNPRVVSAVVQVMRFWLDIGVDGFRLDAIPYLCERDGTNNENLPETHAVIKQLRAELDAYAPGTHAAGRGQPVAGGRARLFRRRRRMPHGLSLPADAAHVHGDRAGGPLPDHRHPAADAGHSRRTASGRCSCATTTS